MKILHVIASADPHGGGPIEGIFRHAAARALEGITTELATLDQPDDPWVAAAPVKVHALGWRTLRSRGLALLPHALQRRYAPQLVPWLRRRAPDYDVVVVNGLWNYASVGAARALIGGPTPYFVFPHGMLDPWFRSKYPVKHALKQLLWFFFEGRLLANARAVLFTTEEERLLARRTFWPYRGTQIVVGYGTADIPDRPAEQRAAFAASLPQLRGRPFLLFLSRIHEKKGVDLLVAAFARWAADFPEVMLVVAGPDETGLRQRLEKQAVEAGVADRIVWPGMLTADVKWGAFRACEGFVLPSHQENFGIAVAEALSAARPVLITNKVNIWREVDGAGAGIVSDDTVEGVTTALGQFLALSAPDRAEMGRRGRQLFLERYDARFVAKSLLDVFQAAKA